MTIANQAGAALRAALNVALDGKPDTGGPGAFTTLSASGEITGTSQRLSSGTSSTTLAGNYALRLTAGSTAANYAGMFFDGSTAYDSFFGRIPSALSGINDGIGYVTYVGGVPTLRVLFSSAGLAVTGAISATSTIRTGGFLVSTLPSGASGDRAYVTDATTPTYLGALTGGGAVVCPVFKNASAWVSS